MLVFLVTAAVDLVLLAKVVTSDNPSSGLIAAVVVLTAILVVVPRIFDIAQLRVLGMSAQLLQEELADTQKVVEATQTAVTQTNERLDSLFALSISDWQFINLKKLSEGSFGPFVRSIGLENDLRHLRNHGYIEIASVRDMPDRGEELCDYVRVTGAGKSFLKLRQSLSIAPPSLTVQEGRLRPTGGHETHDAPDGHAGRPAGYSP
jgi:hypothetical protein